MEDPYNEVARQNMEAAVKENDRENDEDEVEPSEEDIALKSLDREHIEDYLKIKSTVMFTDLSDRLIELAIRLGKAERIPSLGGPSIKDQNIPF